MAGPCQEVTLKSLLRNSTALTHLVRETSTNNSTHDGVSDRTPKINVLMAGQKTPYCFSYWRSLTLISFTIAYSLFSHASLHHNAAKKKPLQSNMQQL